jgi:hypothetical protein
MRAAIISRTSRKISFVNVDDSPTRPAYAPKETIAKTRTASPTKIDRISEPRPGSFILTVRMTCTINSNKTIKSRTLRRVAISNGLYSMSKTEASIGIRP